MKLPHRVIVTAPGLLPLLYKAGELARELGIPERTLRDWLEAGAPSQRDELNRIWINGKAFSHWVKQQRKPKRTVKLPDSQAYCLRCKMVIELQDSQRRKFKGRLVLISGICPSCGGSVFRGGASGTAD